MCFKDTFVLGEIFIPVLMRLLLYTYLNGSYFKLSLKNFCIILCGHIIRERL